MLLERLNVVLGPRDEAIGLGFDALGFRDRVVLSPTETHGQSEDLTQALAQIAHGAGTIRHRVEYRL
ncbi:hypothetical protein D3C72_644240 [compost metagenome]